MTRDARETVALALAATVGLFVLSTLIVVFVLALRGVALPDIWTSLFGLVIAIMSALGGWLLGKNRAPPDPPTLPAPGTNERPTNGRHV